MPTRKWRSESTVNTTLTGVQSESDVAALAGGGYVVVWRDGGVAPANVRAQRFDALGNKVGAEIDVGSGFASASIQPSVTGLANGGFYVTFTGPAFSHIEGQAYDANGALTGYQPVAFVAGGDTDSDAAAFGAGSVVVWTDPEGDTDPDVESRSPDILFRIFGGGAGTNGVIFAANDQSNAAGSSDQQAAVATRGSNFVAAWASRPFFGPDFNIKIRIFDSNAVAQTGEIFVTAAAGEQTAPAVAWLASNRIAVAWHDAAAGGGDIDGAIRLKIFAADGTALTGEITVNETTFNDQRDAAITALPNGGFVVSWTDASQTAPDSSIAIRLQAFGASGTKIGGEIVVNTGTLGNQSAPSLAALADSRVVVTWTDAATGDIRQQIVDPRDGVVDGTDAGETLYGHDAVGDIISAAEGNDTAFGLNGDDSLYGGGGSDTLHGGLGSDYLDGGDGADTASYASALVRVKLALDGSFLPEGEAAFDTLVSIERLAGSAFGDVLRGDAGANRLLGGGGNDTLQSMDGADTLVGGTGGDALTGGLGNDGFEFTSTSHGGDTINDFHNFAGDNDTLRFAGTAFGGLTVGALDPVRFLANATGLASNSSQRFIYETDTGTLRYDSNGTGAGGITIMATLTGIAAITAADIVII